MKNICRHYDIACSRFRWRHEMPDQLSSQLTHWRDQVGAHLIGHRNAIISFRTLIIFPPLPGRPAKNWLSTAALSKQCRKLLFLLRTAMSSSPSFVGASIAFYVFYKFVNVVAQKKQTFTDWYFLYNLILHFPWAISIFLAIRQIMRSSDQCARAIWYLVLYIIDFSLI